MNRLTGWGSSVCCLRSAGLENNAPEYSQEFTCPHCPSTLAIARKLPAFSPTHVANPGAQWTAAVASLNNSMASVQAQVAGPAQQAEQQQQLWGDARASLQTGVAILVAAAAAFGLFVWRMPPLQVRGHTQAAPCLACKQAPQPHTRCAAAAAASAASTQTHELAALMANFPPRSLSSVITVRDTMLAYAQSYPVSSRAAATTQLAPTSPCLFSLPWG